MRNTTIGILLTIVFIQFITSIVAPNLGVYEVTGAPVAEEMEQGEAPSAWDSLSWIWESITFAFDMTTFQVEGAEELSAVWNLMTLAVIVCIIFLARGI